MGRYLLVEIDHNSTAERLRAQLDKLPASKGIRIIGMYTRPTTLCECAASPSESVKGAKFGWWLCQFCRKPKSGAAQLLRNLLDDEDCPAKYRNLMLPLKWIKNKVTGEVETARSLPKEDWR